MCPSLDSTDFDLGYVRRSLERREDPFLDYQVEYRRTVDSASNVVGAFGEDGLREGLVLIAGEQLAGVGQNRERWHGDVAGAGNEESSFRSANVTMAVVLNEAATPAEFALGRMAMALAVVDALRKVAEDSRLPVRFRAPNDVYSYDPDPARGIRYRKIAGLLAASRHCPKAVAALESIPAIKPERFQVLGIGINLTRSLLATPALYRGTEIALSEVATSLETLTGVRHAPETVVAELLLRFEKHLFEVRHGGDGSGFFTHVYRNMARDAEGRITLELMEDEGKDPPVCRHGKALSVTASGLLVDLGGQRRAFAFEEIARFYPYGTSDL